MVKITMVKENASWLMFFAAEHVLQQGCSRGASGGDTSTDDTPRAIDTD